MQNFKQSTCATDQELAPARSPSTPPPPSSQDRFLSLAQLPTAYKILSAATAAALCSTAARLAENFLSKPSYDTLLDFAAFPKVGLVPGLKRGRGRKERHAVSQSRLARVNGTGRCSDGEAPPCPLSRPLSRRVTPNPRPNESVSISSSPDHAGPAPMSDLTYPCSHIETIVMMTSPGVDTLD
jgi:hypothetical protein